MVGSKESMMSRLRGDGIGRMPVFLRDLTLGLDAAGMIPADVFSNGYDSEKSSLAVRAFQRMTGQDAVVGCIHSAAFIVEQFGGSMSYSKNRIPNVRTPPFGKYEDPVGRDVVPFGSAENALRSYSLVRESIPDVAIAGNVTGPMTKASVLMGIDNLSIALETEPDYVHEIIRLGLSNTECVLDRFEKDSSADFVFLAAASDNPDLFGPKAYREFCLGYLPRVVSYSRKKGFPVAMHPHGDFAAEYSELLPETISTGIAGFQFVENNNPAVIKASIGGKCALMGGTDVVPTLMDGDRDEITSETRRYIDECIGPRYVFMCSCSLHVGTPLESIDAMVTAARESSVAKGP